MNIGRYTFESRKSVPKWLKSSLLIVLLLLVIALIYGLFLYKDIQQSKTEGESVAEKEVLEQTDVKSIDNLTHFYGEETYRILRGKTKENKEKLVFVLQNDKKKTDKITVIDNDKILQKEEMLSLWEKECNHCEFIKMGPAMIKEDPLWEITYRDDTDRYVIEYASMYDGTEYEQYRLRETFH